jgi:hypothetical protein
VCVCVCVCVSLPNVVTFSLSDRMKFKSTAVQWSDLEY